MKKNSAIKFIGMVLVFLFVFCLCSCGAGKETGEGETPPPTPVVPEPEVPEEPEEILEYRSYVNAVYSKPFWEGSIVYNETVLFMEKSDVAPLAFKIDEIIAVQSYDLTKLYEEGKDYDVKDGLLKLTENTSIPYFTKAELYPGDDYYKTPTDRENYACNSENGKYFLKSEGTTFPKKQIAVTYRHSEKWNGFRPVPQTEKFPKTMQKLRNKEQIKVLFYGDSITTGCNSSCKIGMSPNAEIFPEMIVTNLKDRYGYDGIQYVNNAVGGTGYSWACNNAKSKVIEERPDLIVLAFGMNDRCSANQYESGMRILVEMICEGLPDAEIMLISTTLPNPESAKFSCHQSEFEEKLEQIASNKQNVALTKMTSMHKVLLSRKRFRDMTGSGLNHPNDFLARTYAQMFIKTLIG